MYKLYLIFIEKSNGFRKAKPMLILYKTVINVDETLIHLYYAQIYFQVNQYVINISNFDVNKETLMKHCDSLSSRGTYLI